MAQQTTDASYIGMGTSKYAGDAEQPVAHPLEMVGQCGMFRRRVKTFVIDNQVRTINKAVPIDAWGAIVVDLEGTHAEN